jgi:hypothetical protein
LVECLAAPRRCRPAARHRRHRRVLPGERDDRSGHELLGADRLPARPPDQRGVSRGNHVNGPPEPLARFGIVYFDDLNAFATSGQPRLLDGTATSMTELNGTVLAQPERLTDFTFKAVHA